MPDKYKISDRFNTAIETLRAFLSDKENLDLADVYRLAAGLLGPDDAGARAGSRRGRPATGRKRGSLRGRYRAGRIATGGLALDLDNYLAAGHQLAIHVQPQLLVCRQHADQVRPLVQDSL